MQTHDTATSAAWGPIMSERAPPEIEAHDAPETAHVATRAERVLEAASKALHLCGHGTMRTWGDGSRMTPTAKFADLLYTECSCCWVWRGIFVGLATGFVAGALVASLIFAKI